MLNILKRWGILKSASQCRGRHVLQRRRMRLESLESRQLFAADLLSDGASLVDDNHAPHDQLCESSALHRSERRKG